MSNRNSTSSRKPLSAVSHEINEIDPSGVITRCVRQGKTDDIARGLYKNLSPKDRRSFVALMKAVEAERDLTASILSGKAAGDEAVKVEAQATWLN